MLEISYNNGQPLYVRGGIGIGKSETIKEFAMECAARAQREFMAWNDIPKCEKLEVMAHTSKYFTFVDQRALMLDLGDFKLPRFDENGGFEWCIPMVYAYMCMPETKAILFLDEFNLAPPSIQGMFYQIVNDREIGENHLSDGVYVVAAGNDITDRAAVYEIPYPLRNRFLNVKLAQPNADDWTVWGAGHGIDSRVLAFIKFKPSLLYKPGLDGEYSFPTPRSWEKLSRCISGLKDYEQIRMIAESAVGEATAVEFTAHVKLYDNVDLDNILDHPDEVTRITEPQLLFGVAGGLIEKYRANKKKLSKIAAVADNMRPEYSIWMYRTIKGMNKNFTRELVAAVDLDKFTERYGKYLN
ncbi:putative AAA ATPase [Methanocella paludicola SANAE]|uniref:AAA ATPase n=1 Tax=Methanocella paludicola (strain DSM 17711 / JCM 13418 / NBRC 101707 / SANAE) TaxID=304371 RepID=D1YYZ7_METPS|nr:ATPase AAA [Methanocella paludicola]BAI61669.1 putative AAA ATPase [Methanocella paludicola SANAE]